MPSQSPIFFRRPRQAHAERYAPSRRAVLSLILLMAAALAAAPALAQDCATGTASARLDANNVNAGLGNQGALFRTSEGGYSQYEVPAGSGLASIFVSGLWLGGTVNGELRMAAATYAQFEATYEFYPGPLGLDGQTPSDCGTYDRIYKVTAEERDQYVASGGATTTNNITDWPVGLGAPTLVYDADASGDETGAFEPPVIDGASDGAYVPFYGFDPSEPEGEGVTPNPQRTLDLSTVVAGGATIPVGVPDVTGEQTLWWVMNDGAGPHGTTGANPIGMEVRVTAFAAQGATAVNNSTAYELQLIYRGTPSTSQTPLENFYLGLWADTDLGNARDDFVGSDSTLGLGYTYNGDANDDVASYGYGNNPPALGYDFLQGPLVDANSKDDDGDGDTDEAGERLGMSKFVYYNNVNGSATGNPGSAQNFYRYLRGIWLDGSPIQLGGDGYNEGTEPVDYMFPADPPDYWSEEDTSPEPGRQGNVPSDRRFVMSTGPFTMAPDEVQEIAFSVVWAQESNRFGSIASMKKASNVVQEALGYGTDTAVEIPPAPTAAPTPLAPADGAAGQPTNPTLQWAPTNDADFYEVQVASDQSFSSVVDTVRVPRERARAELPSEEGSYHWRVRGATAGGDGPWSETRRFSTSDEALETAGALYLSSGDPAFVEVVAPGGGDPCAGDGALGCDQVGGDLVTNGNSTGEYYLGDAFSGSSEDFLPRFAPNNYEIRFTEEGSYGIHPFGDSSVVHEVPFEVWDIGNEPPGTESDPSDDVQLIPTLLSISGGVCAFEFGETQKFGRAGTDHIFAYYPADSYASFAGEAEAALQGDADGCAPAGYSVLGAADFERDRPLQGEMIIRNAEDFTVSDMQGAVIRFYTTAFSVLPPVLSAPEDEAAVGPAPTLAWNPPPDASSAQVQVAASASFDDLVASDSNRAASSYTPTLESDGDYFWRVRVTSGGGAVSDWSEVQRFSVTSTATDDVAGLPQDVTLRPSYPNPVRRAATLRYGLPQAARVRLAVYDVLGRRVATMTDRKQTAGWHDLRWNADRLASGVYVLRLTAGGEQRTRKVVVVR